MAIEVSDYPSVMSKCKSLGFDVKKGIVLLPKNFEEMESLDESVHFSSSTTVSKLLHKANLTALVVEQEGEQKRLVQKNVTWYGPILFFAVAELSSNPQLLTVSLGVISSYLTTLFKGAPKDEVEISLNIVTEQTKTKKTRKFEYRGGIEGLKTLEHAILEEVKNDAGN